MAIGATNPPRLPIMFIAPENVPANRPPTSMHAPQAQGSAKSLNSPASPMKNGQRERTAPVGGGSEQAHGGGHEAEGAERPAGAADAAHPPGERAGAEARDERADAAAEQREAGQHGQHHGAHRRAVRPLEIRGEPGDVEVPDVAQARVLNPQQPGRARSGKDTPRHPAVTRREVLDAREQAFLGVVDRRVLVRVVAEPAVEEERPHEPEQAEQLERPPPRRHQAEHRHHQQRRDGAAPARRQPEHALRAHALVARQPGRERLGDVRESSRPRPRRTGSARRSWRARTRPGPWRR